jgi:hypothetical protein
LFEVDAGNLAWLVRLGSGSSADWLAKRASFYGQVYGLVPPGVPVLEWLNGLDRRGSVRVGHCLNA